MPTSLLSGIPQDGSCQRHQLQPALANIDFNALNQTLANAQRTIRDMDDVLTELKSYPSGFIFGSPPPPVKEVQARKK